MEEANSLQVPVPKPPFPPSFSLPAPFLMVFDVVKIIHRTWKWFKQASYAKNELPAFLIGHAINAAIGIHDCALPVIFLSRVLICFKEKKNLSYQIKNWKVAIWRANYPEIAWKKAPKYGFKASFLWNCQFKVQQKYLKIKKIIHATFQLLSSFFLLNMKMLDAIDTFYCKEEAKPEIFVHLQLIKNYFNQERLNSLFLAIDTKDSLLKKILGPYAKTLEDKEQAQLLKEKITFLFRLVVQTEDLKPPPKALMENKEPPKQEETVFETIKRLFSKSTENTHQNDLIPKETKEDFLHIKL